MQEEQAQRAHGALAQQDTDARFHARHVSFTDMHEQLHNQVIVEPLSPVAEHYDAAAALLRKGAALEDADVTGVLADAEYLELKATIYRDRAAAAAHFASRR